jgi:hypothetical protein
MAESGDTLPKIEEVDPDDPSTWPVIPFEDMPKYLDSIKGLLEKKFGEITNPMKPLTETPINPIQQEASVADQKDQVESIQDILTRLHLDVFLNNLDDRIKKDTHTFLEKQIPEWSAAPPVLIPIDKNPLSFPNGDMRAPKE